MQAKHILTWIRPYRGLPKEPMETPFGRAAMVLEKENIQLLLAATPSSWSTVSNGTWIAVEPRAVSAIYDRYSSRSLPEHYAGLERQGGQTPRSNPPDLIRLCSDKVETQRVLHNLPFPELQADPLQFKDSLSNWGLAYLKPRFGGLGRGIHRVQPGDPLPAWGPGAVKGGSEPTFLQRAITPPAKLGSLCVRWLIQRDPDGKWSALPAVARISEKAVANVHQGAQALAAENVLPPEALKKARELVYEVARQLQARCNGLVVELGVDLVFDKDFRPWLLEINSRPSGRFQALSKTDPDRYNSLADEAVLRPIRCLAALS